MPIIIPLLCYPTILLCIKNLIHNHLLYSSTNKTYLSFPWEGELGINTPCNVVSLRGWRANLPVSDTTTITRQIHLTKCFIQFQNILLCMYATINHHIHHTKSFGFSHTHLLGEYPPPHLWKKNLA